MKTKEKGLTLIETLIGIVLLSVIVIGFFNIEYFARAQVLYADRRIKVHNEAMILMEHMAKHIAMAIGNIPRDGVNTAVVTNIYNYLTNPVGGDRSIVVYTDANGNGLKDSPLAVGSDVRIAYRLRPATAPLAQRYQVWYYPTYLLGANLFEVIATNVTAINFISILTNNFITIDATFCFNASGVPDACGSAANPSERITADIVLPMVSVR